MSGFYEDLPNAIIVQSLESHVETLEEKIVSLDKENAKLKSDLVIVHQLIDEILQTERKNHSSENKALISELQQAVKERENEFSQAMNWFYEERALNDELKNKFEEHMKTNSDLHRELEEQTQWDKTPEFLNTTSFCRRPDSPVPFALYSVSPFNHDGKFPYSPRM